MVLWSYHVHLMNHLLPFIISRVVQMVVLNDVVCAFIGILVVSFFFSLILVV
jgi:hypothetical protein